LAVDLRRRHPSRGHAEKSRLSGSLQAATLQQIRMIAADI
jgi:hypothetical protein